MSKLDFLRSCPCSSLNKKVFMYLIQSFEFVYLCFCLCICFCLCFFCVCWVLFIIVCSLPGVQQAVLLAASWEGSLPGSSSSPATHFSTTCKGDANKHLVHPIVSVVVFAALKLSVRLSISNLHKGLVFVESLPSETTLAWVWNPYYGYLHQLAINYLFFIL